ncbi:MAG TPA: hypothetical protein VG297_26520 [Bryobacteraceae bacterium]|nr:hypothetical protein [Bryobacteraceae bacterium]
MSVRITIDIPDDINAALRRRAAAEHTSIRSLITGAIEVQLRGRRSQRVTGPLVGKRASQPPAASAERILTTSCLPDLKVWLALSWANHMHSGAAWESRSNAPTPRRRSQDFRVQFVRLELKAGPARTRPDG